jgi:hypothetical protein
MLTLSDSQLRRVMAAAGGLPVERRGEFLERVAARMRGADVAALADAMQAAV